MSASIGAWRHRAKDLRQRSGGLFALLFDSRIPPLFIVGLILSAVLGNGVYDLFTRLLGGGLTSVLLALGFAILTMIAVVVGGYVAIISAFPASDSYGGLVVLLGPLAATAREAIAYHVAKGNLGYCCLVVPQALEQRLHGEIESLLRDGASVQPHPIQYRIMVLGDEHDASQTEAVVLKALTDAREVTRRAPIVVDITSGTKAMTIGAIQVCREYDVPMEYLRPHRDPYGKPLSDVPPDMVFI